MSKALNILETEICEHLRKIEHDGTFKTMNQIETLNEMLKLYHHLCAFEKSEGYEERYHTTQNGHSSIPVVTVYGDSDDTFHIVPSKTDADNDHVMM